MKLGTLRLFVNNLDAALAFYRDLLGIKLLHDGRAQGYLLFDAGLSLVLETVADDAPPQEQALVGRFSGASFTVADIQAEHLRLSAAGVAFDAPPEKQFWGGWTASFTDPAGNTLQLAQLPG